MNKREITILMQLQDRVSAGFKRISQSFGSAMNRMQMDARQMEQGLKTITVAAGIVAGAIALIGSSSISAAMDMQRMRMSLTAVMGSAQKATAHFKELEEVAKLPGLGLQEAVQGSIRLQSVGISAREATAQLTAFGGAIARVGGGRTELARVVEQIAQMAGKSQILMEDLRPIQSVMPDINKAMQSAFGTSNIEQIRDMGITTREFISQVTTELAKLPGVGNTAANSIENLQDNIFKLRAALGEALLPTFSKIIDQLTKIVTWFNNLSQTQKSMIAWSGVVVGGIASLTAGLGGLALALPSIIAGFQAMGPVLLFLSGPAGPILATVAALGLLTVSIFKLNDGITRFNLAREIKGLTQSLEELGDTATAETIEEYDKALIRMYEIHARLSGREAEIVAQNIDRIIAKREELMAAVPELMTTVEPLEVAPMAKPVMQLSKDLAKIMEWNAKRRKELLGEEIQLTIGATDTYYNFMKRRQQQLLQAIKEEHEARRKAVNKDIDFQERLEAGTARLREKEAKEFQRSAEKISKEQRDLQEKGTAWYEKHVQGRMERQREIESKAYQTRIEDFKKFSDEVMEASDIQLENFIADVEDMQFGWSDSIGFMSLAFEGFANEFDGTMGKIMNISSIASDVVAGDWISAAQKGSKSWIEFGKGLGEWLNLQVSGGETIEELNQQFNELFNMITTEQQKAVKQALTGFKMDATTYRSWINKMSEWLTQADAMNTFRENIASSLSETLLRGLREGLAITQIGDDIERFLKEQVFERAIQAILTNMPIMQTVIEKWSKLVSDALDPISEGGATITQDEMKYIGKAGRELRWIIEGVAEEGKKLADVLGLTFGATAGTGGMANLPLEFTKTGIFENGLTNPQLADLLMKPQRVALGLESGAQAAPGISGALNTQPNVNFVQNNEFSGLVNFDNPEAMRELARKLQPYTEELQENWVN